MLLFFFCVPFLHSLVSQFSSTRNRPSTYSLIGGPSSFFFSPPGWIDSSGFSVHHQSFSLLPILLTPFQASIPDLFLTSHSLFLLLSAPTFLRLLSFSSHSLSVLHFKKNPPKLQVSVNLHPSFSALCLLSHLHCYVRWLGLTPSVAPEGSSVWGFGDSPVG